MKIPYKPFLRWWLIAAIGVATVVVSAVSGLLEQAYRADATGLINPAIGLITIIMTGWCGLLTWRFSRLANNVQAINPSRLQRIIRDTYNGGFWAVKCTGLGLIGTVAGFIIMFTGEFTQLNLDNPETTVGVLNSIAAGMGTALFTTAVGLLASIFIELQYFNLRQAIRKYDLSLKVDPE